MVIVQSKSLKLIFFDNFSFLLKLIHLKMAYFMEIYVFNVFQLIILIVYDKMGSQSDRDCVILNPIYIDVTDYTKPIKCTHDEFLKKWKDLDWENMVII